VAIGLFIGYQDPAKEDRLLPIASEVAFADQWKPLCRELRLRWVSRFPTGWSLSLQDVPPILRELEQIRAHLLAAGTHSQAEEQMRTRIENLSLALEEIRASRDVEAFIGCVRPVRRSRPVSVFRRPMASPVPNYLPDNPLPGKSAPTKPSGMSWRLALAGLRLL
jgi:hypothetical protein